MTRTEKCFAEYSTYHRHPHNELTHLVGIPAIVLAMVVWASIIGLGTAGGVPLDLGVVLIAGTSLFYIWLSPGLGLLAAVLLAGMYALAVTVLGRSGWIALALFVGGWVLQFVGHHFEGKRPAFTKNALHLLIGPLYILDRALARLTGRRTEPAAH